MEVDLDTDAEREDYLDGFRGAVATQSFPECDIELAHALVDAEFVVQRARADGHEEFATTLDAVIEEALADFEEIKEWKSIDAMTESQNALLAATQTFGESIGSFTADGEGGVVHGGDVANRFIVAENVEEAHRTLGEFREWFADDLDDVTRERESIEYIGKTYSTEEYRDVALFYGLLLLCYRRRKGEVFTEEEMRVP